MSDIESNNVVNSQTVETIVDDRSDKLTNREALEQAITEKRGDSSSDTRETISRTDAPTQKEVKAAVEADIDPPSEFSDKGKQAWKDKDIRGIQEEYKRVSTSRLQELSRAQTAERQARESSKPIKDLADKVKNYLAVRGEDDLPDEVKIAQALQLVNELKKGDRASVKAELKAIGIDLDSPDNSPLKTDSQKDALQEQVNSLLQKERERDFQNISQTFATVFENLTSQKTRTGETVFPGLLDTSESGIQFAKELGSLTQDQRFQQGVLRRFPDADMNILVREAYKYLGGKVSGEPVEVSTSTNQKHIDKSRRAATLAPQGSTVRSRNDSSNLVGKLANRAALMKALAESREH